MEQNQRPPSYIDNKTTKHDDDNLQYGNIKERLNLHVKRRLNVQPQRIAQKNIQMPKAPNVPPIQISSDTLASGDVLQTKNISTSQQQIQQFPKVPRRPYTKRKDKTRPPVINNNSKSGINSKVESICSVQFVNNKNILNGAAPIVSVRKYNKRRNLTTGENISITTNSIINNCPEGGKDGGAGDDGSQDVEVRGRHNDRDKSLDILSLVLNSKKRSLMQCPEIQNVIKSLTNTNRK